MKIDYYIVNPTGNITILIETPVSIENRVRIASEIMKKHPEAEQAGYIIRSENGCFLNMAGGEFCGNASLGAGAVFAEKEGRDGTFSINVSGAGNPVEVTVSKQSDGSYSGSVNMPPAESIGMRTFTDGEKEYEFPLIDFGGISHIICEEKIEKSRAESLIKEWYKSLDTPCLGIMFADYENRILTPLVYSGNAGTLFWESSCASGTTAAGVYYSYRQSTPIDISFSEPYGTLGIKVDNIDEPVLIGKAVIEGRFSADIQ